MRLAEARARRSVLLRDKSFISTDGKCSSDCCERALNTTPRAQVNQTAAGRGECFNHLAHRQRMPIDRLPVQRGTKRGNSGHTHFQVLMVEIHYPVCTIEKRRTSTMEQVAGSI